MRGQRCCCVSFPSDTWERRSPSSVSTCSNRGLFNRASLRAGSPQESLLWRPWQCSSFLLLPHHLQQQFLLHPWLQWLQPLPWLVLATGTGNPPAVQVWTTKTGRFGSRPVQNLDPLTLSAPNTDPYPSTHGFFRVCLDPSVPISGSAFWISHLWSHSDMLLLIVKY